MCIVSHCRSKYALRIKCLSSGTPQPTIQIQAVASENPPGLAYKALNDRMLSLFPVDQQPLLSMNNHSLESICPPELEQELPVSSLERLSAFCGYLAIRKFGVNVSFGSKIASQCQI